MESEEEPNKRNYDWKKRKCLLMKTMNIIASLVEKCLMSARILKKDLSIVIINDKNFSFHAYERYCQVRFEDQYLRLQSMRNGGFFKIEFEIEVPLKCNLS